LNLEPTDYESAALTIELRAQTFLSQNFTAILPNRIFAAYAQFYAYPNPRRQLAGHLQLPEGVLGRRVHVTLRNRDAAVAGDFHDGDGDRATSRAWGCQSFPKTQIPKRTLSAGQPALVCTRAVRLTVRRARADFPSGPACL
jgi:hypothetical protein